jgi:hypothetical protein
MRTNRSFLLAILVGLAGFGPLSADPEPYTKYSEVEFDLSKVSMEELGALGIPLESNASPDDKHFVGPVSPYDLSLLAKHGIPHKLLIDDMAKFYEERILREKAESQAARTGSGLTRPPPKNFKHGSFAGSLTLSEIEKELDEMRRLYPKFVSAKFEIGKSRENRPVNAIRISNNPDVDQDKPKAVYNTLMHAREPMSVLSMTYFIWTLLEGYETDANIRRIIDNIEIYYVPCVNPDGYEYNRSTNPNGGGMWRKNRATNPDGTRGVDPNRNFSVNWGNNAGSSTAGSSDTFRGPAAFSEPETKNIRDLYLSKKFTISSNFHTFANKLLHPYGLGSYPANRAEYERVSRDITRVNGWEFGVVPPTIGYSAAGIEIDWAHDVAKTLAFNPEMGSAADGGFWPIASRIDAIAASGLEMNMVIARYAVPAVVRVSMQNYKEPIFHADTKGAGREWNFRYQISDPKQSWYLTVYDLQGKQSKRYELSPSGNSLTLSRSELPGSLFLLSVKSCMGSNCKSVYNEKVTLSGF